MSSEGDQAEKDQVTVRIVKEISGSVDPFVALYEKRLRRVAPINRTIQNASFGQWGGLSKYTLQRLAAKAVFESYCMLRYLGFEKVAGEIVGSSPDEKEKNLSVDK